MSFAAEVRENTRSIEETETLRQQVRRELEAIAGEAWVYTDPAVLDTYGWQYLAEASSPDASHYMPRPLAIALPADAAQVAAIVKLCNRLGIQSKAISTGFGMWGAPHVPDHVVQIDLRRLDRIVKIDRDNMYAVVEPCVTGSQLQTEAMKVGLNTHIAGCGAQCSVLASATSVMGQGWDGVSMGFSNRNLLGFEWVTPEGEVVQVGSFDAAGEEFLGDGPGFSIRGIIRGFAGAFGGLGVFTRAAIKLYPWEGPEKLAVSGRSPNYFTEIPQHHTVGILGLRDWRGMADVGYKLGEAEILTYLSRNAPSVMAGVLGEDNNEVAAVYRIPLVRELYYALGFVMTARHAAEAAWKRKVLRRILDEVGGGLLSNDLSPAGARRTLRFFGLLWRQIGARDFLRSLPGFGALVWRDARRYGWRRAPLALSALLYQAMVRSGMNMRGIFRFAGTFWTAMGSLVSWDNALHGARVGAEVKKKYIRKGVIVDDGGDNAWGGLYEGGAYAHLEELAMYDQTDPACKEGVLEYIVETNLQCIEQKAGDSLNAVGPLNHVLFSPACMDYDKYTQRIKAAFDPRNASDPSVYTDPDFQLPERAVRAMERVAAEPLTIRVEADHIPGRPNGGAHGGRER